MSERDVDLCVNCYERTYRQVLTPGFFPGLIAEHRHGFARRTAIINNVADRAHAEGLAEGLRRSGELDAWYFVNDHLAGAMERTGVTDVELSPAPHFTDWGLVLVTLPGPDLILHCDPEVRMREPYDWVKPSVALLGRDRRVMIANPRWHITTEPPGALARQELERSGDFSLGLGFSDQLFVARRSDLAAPIYRQRCVATRRYPMSNVSPTFEARIDAWMRHHDRLRATYLRATYVHPDTIGEGYPDRRPTEKLRAVVNPAVIALVRRMPVKRRCWRGL